MHANCFAVTRRAACDQLAICSVSRWSALSTMSGYRFARVPKCNHPAIVCVTGGCPLGTKSIVSCHIRLIKRRSNKQLLLLSVELIIVSFSHVMLRASASPVSASIDTLTAELIKKYIFRINTQRPVAALMSVERQLRARRWSGASNYANVPAAAASRTKLSLSLSWFDSQSSALRCVAD